MNHILKRTVLQNTALVLQNAASFNYEAMNVTFPLFVWLS